MTHAYDEMYLEGAMIRLGDMLEYACLDLGYNPDSFFKMFIQSGIARRFEIGDVSLVAGKSGPELAALILEEMDNIGEFTEPAWREERSDFYWCGWLIEYYQWQKNIPFTKIWDSISIRMLQKMYPTLHEADISKAVEEMDKLMKPREAMSVQCLRQMRGLTQKELAERSGMTISQLQRIEYNERKVENLTLKTAIRLSKALGVDIEEMK